MKKGDWYRRETNFQYTDLVTVLFFFKPLLTNNQWVVPSLSAMPWLHSGTHIHTWICIRTTLMRSTSLYWRTSGLLELCYIALIFFSLKHPATLQYTHRSFVVCSGKVHKHGQITKRKNEIKHNSTPSPHITVLQAFYDITLYLRLGQISFKNKVSYWIQICLQDGKKCGKSNYWWKTYSESDSPFF